ncbi:MAG: hypothetical protein IJ874_01210 [Ruminococcus sp.]|nr:hypothetical protein [Ruminococcus sp.]
MKKSVYSLALGDNVIRAVDKEAYRLGTSRSNLVNQILAEYLSVETPEMRMKSTFSRLIELMDSSFQVQDNRNDSVLLRSALPYKYRPTISYRVQIFREQGEYYGRFSAEIRTQNEALTDLFRTFFWNWQEIESRLLWRHGCREYSAGIGRSSFSRSLYNNSGLDEARMGEAIAGYLSFLDSALKDFLENHRSFAEVGGRLEEEYGRLLENSVI